MHNMDSYIKQGNCLDLMTEIPDGSVDMVLCDLPYGKTKMEWDNVISFEHLWKQYERVTKNNSSIVLFSSGLFTVDLILSKKDLYKYKLIWHKNVPTGMSSAKYRPMKYYEEICVFQKGTPTYNPIMKLRIGDKKECYNYNHYCGKSNHIQLDQIKYKYDPNYVQPSDVLDFKVVPNRNGKLHPTQKPIDLCEYLIKTYTNEDEIVLDNCMGSGTTCVAAINTNRKYIGFELNQNYFDIAKNRIEEAING